MPNICKLSQYPIFIVGFPRSGTTLLQSMLATQENIYSFPETHFFCTTMHFIEIDDKGLIKLGCLEAVFRNIKEKTEYELAPDVKETIYALADNHQLSTKSLFEFLVCGLLLEQVEANMLQRIQWVEKTPGHIFYINLIQEYYPNAKFIEIVRNPLNAIYSWKTKFPDGNKYTSTTLAHRWKRAYEIYKRFKEINPDKAYSVKYEILVNDPEGEFRKISKFLNINPDIKKISDVQKVAQRVTLHRESWKNRNINSGIEKNFSDYKWTLNDKLKIRYLLKDELIAIEYENGNPLIQLVFNGYMYSITKFASLQILNWLKKPVKNLVIKAGVWPYEN